jgi:phytoene synthase
VDDAPSLQAAQEKLEIWRQDIERVFSDKMPHSPLLQQFLAIHRKYHFDRADIHAMLDALAMDAQGRMQGPSMAELEQYCYGVASATGLMSMQIFGCSQPEARPFAIALGHALQLTNILRDVQMDARIGRVYLPQEVMPSALSAQMLMQHPQTAQPACMALSRHALHYFSEADSYAHQLPTRAIAPALAMRDVYALYWKKLEAQQWHAPATGKIALTPAEKATLATRASGYLLGKFRANAH